MRYSLGGTSCSEGIVNSQDASVTPTGFEMKLALDEPQARIKSHLSGFLASAAALFARQAFAIEKDHVDEPPEQVLMDHRSYCLGAIISAVGYLEAAINELYLEAFDRNPNTFGKADPQLPRLMEEFWPEVEVHSILTKYQTALALARVPAYEKDKEPYQSVQALIHLRNALVHYKPEWDTDLEEHRKLEARLMGKFAPSTLSAPTQTFIPHKVLGHGCAEWAVRTSTTFLKDFMKRMGLPPREISEPAGLATR